jgi:hypothetical protein
MPDLDAKFKSQYETSTDAVQREKIIKEIQTEVNDRYVFPYVYNLGLTMATGPRVLNTPEEIWFSIPQYVYVFPFEDIKVKA